MGIRGGPSQGKGSGPGFPSVKGQGPGPSQVVHTTLPSPCLPKSPWEVHKPRIDPMSCVGLGTTPTTLDCLTRNVPLSVPPVRLLHLISSSAFVPRTLVLTFSSSQSFVTSEDDPQNPLRLQPAPVLPTYSDPWGVSVPRIFTTLTLSVASWEVSGAVSRSVTTEVKCGTHPPFTIIAGGTFHRSFRKKKKNGFERILNLSRFTEKNE